MPSVSEAAYRDQGAKNLQWAELVVEVNHRAEEVVAEILAGETARGVEIAPAGQNRSSIRGYLPAGTALEEEHRAALERQLEFLNENLDFEICYTVEINYLEDTDWAENWKEHFHPQQVTERITICPTWHRDDYVSGPEEIVLYIDPGMAFGTGTHPTTVLSLRAVEQYLAGGEYVIDCGTGTGILTMAALRLGAEEVLAVDIDEKACRTADRNLKINGLSERTTVKKLDLLSDPIPEKQSDLIMANILIEVIVPMLKRVGAWLREDGLFIVSGLLRTQLPKFRRTLGETQFCCLEERRLDEWAALVLKKEGD